jgi:hypothetical protein
MPRMPRMNDEMLDRMLASEEELIPSSGFAASVMERIREEAAASPPIPFPWKRAIPGIALTAVVFGGGVVELSRGAIAAAHDGPHLSVHLSLAVLAPFESIGWVGLALGLSLASWTASRWMTGGSRL